MADFDTLKVQVRSAQAGLESQKRDIFLASERVRRLELDKQRVARSLGAESDSFKALSSQQDEWRQRVEAGRGQLKQALIQTEDLAYFVMLTTLLLTLTRTAIESFRWR